MIFSFQQQNVLSNKELLPEKKYRKREVIIKTNICGQAQWLKSVILATQEARLGKWWLKPAHTKSSPDPISTNKNWAWWCTPVIPAT
jgi:hypothetical protein